MNTNAAGRQIIMESESLRLQAYLCPAGRWTIGYGHTGDVKQGDTITEHQAEVILELDIDRVEKIVERAVIVTLNTNQFSALVSFAFNIGPGARGVKSGLVTLKDGRPSTLLEKVNSCRFLAAAEEFPRWTNDHDAQGNPVPLPGLVKRRAAERALFLQSIS